MAFLKLSAWKLAVGLALVFFLAPFSRAEAPPEVRDNAHLFDAATIERVNTIVQEIQQRFHKDLTIETFAELDPRQQEVLASVGKDKFYEALVRQEARAAGTNGIFVLIVRHPGRLQVGVGRTSHQAFTSENRDELVRKMLADFHQKKFNEGIISGAKYVQQAMAHNLGESVTVENPSSPTTTASASHPATRPTTRPTTAPAAESRAQTAPAEENGKSSAPAAAPRNDSTGDIPSKTPDATAKQPDSASNAPDATSKTPDATSKTPDSTSKPDSNKTDAPSKPESGAPEHTDAPAPGRDRDLNK